MIALDTNVIVRHLVQDDPKQSAIASRFIERRLGPDNPGFVSVVVLCEIAWVLREAYKTPRASIADVIVHLLFASEIVVEDTEIVQAALEQYEREDIDFADALIRQIALQAGCDETVTFDKAFARLSAVRLLS